MSFGEMTNCPDDRPRRSRRVVRYAGVVLGASAVGLLLVAATAAAAPISYPSTGSTIATTPPGAPDSDGVLGGFKNSTLPSVVAPNGDQTPFGITVVPETARNLVKGNILVDEYGDAAGVAGQGTIVLQVGPTTGATSVFFQEVAAADSVKRVSPTFQITADPGAPQYARPTWRRGIRPLWSLR
jgi:hypothetical protein